MALNLNPAYEAIGKGFVQQYYALFDDPNQRPSLVNMYNVETSFMTFEGLQIQGSIKIMEKLNSLSFQKINRIITAIDSQPMFDGGVLINVLGRLQTGPPRYRLTEMSENNTLPLYCLIDYPICDDDPPHPFSQIFVLKPVPGSFYLQHDIFRLGIHDTA